MGDSMDEVLRLQFEVSHREDITVTLDDARPWRAVRDAAHIPGRALRRGRAPGAGAPARGPRTRTTAILGLDPRAWTSTGSSARTTARSRLPAAGLSLSRPLGESLGVRAGDEVDIEVLEADRRKVRVPVAALVDDFLGHRRVHGRDGARAR